MRIVIVNILILFFTSSCSKEPVINDQNISNSDTTITDTLTDNEPSINWELYYDTVNIQRVIEDLSLNEFSYEHPTLRNLYARVGMEKFFGISAFGGIIVCNDGYSFIIMDTIDLDFTIIWYPINGGCESFYSDNFNSHNSSNDLGTGYDNTHNVVNHVESKCYYTKRNTYAPGIVVGATRYNYEDWFLPSSGTVGLMRNYYNKDTSSTTRTKFNLNGLYWTSSVTGPFHNEVTCFAPGDQMIIRPINWRDEAKIRIFRKQTF